MKHADVLAISFSFAVFGHYFGFEKTPDEVLSSFFRYYRNKNNRQNSLVHRLGTSFLGKRTCFCKYSKIGTFKVIRQKRLSRKKLGSKNRKKQIIVVEKAHRTIRDQRKDFAHKLSRNMVDTYDSIKFEDLQIKNNSWNSLIQQVQTCICGFSVPKDLSVRTQGGSFTQETYPYYSGPR